MPVTDYGWAPRKIFVVNRGDQQTGFSVNFLQGIMNKVSGILLLTLLALSTAIFF
jgi:hypothetical protein